MLFAPLVAIFSQGETLLEETRTTPARATRRGIGRRRVTRKQAPGEAALQSGFPQLTATAEPEGRRRPVIRDLLTNN